MKYLIRTVILLILFHLSFFFSVNAQSDGESIVIGKKFELPSQVLGENRPYLIGLPDEYDNNTDQTYPVVYLLDGDGHFHHTTGTVNFLARSGRMPGVIVVGIPNTTDRTRDLTPPITKADPSNFPTAGGADDMLRFISEELVPHIEKSYRTSPYKLLIGHSFGGLFATHALVHRPELFNAYLSISPSLWWDEQLLVDQATSFLEKNPDFESTLYMTMGNEGGPMLGGAWKLSAALEEKAPEGLRWEFRLMEEETHGSIPHRSTYYGLEMIFKDWNNLTDPLTVFENGGLKAIENHYQKMEQQFGISGLKAPEYLLNQLGYQLLGQNRNKEAIDVFLQNVKNYPKSFNVYDSLGEGYKENNQNDEAIQHYKKSLALNPGNENAIKMLTEMGEAYQDPTVEVAPDILKTYVGKFAPAPGIIVAFTIEDGKLFGQPSGATKEQLYPITENHFYLKIRGENIQVVFNKNGKGIVDSINVNMNGQEMVGKRVE